MTIKFLGSGGAFSTDDENYNSNIAIYEDSDYLLFDAGTDIKNSLHCAGIEVGSISQIFISHLHSDHCGGVEYMGFRTMFDSNIDKKIVLISETHHPHIQETTFLGLGSILFKNIPNNSTISKKSSIL